MDSIDAVWLIWRDDRSDRGHDLVGIYLTPEGAWERAEQEAAETAEEFGHHPSWSRVWSERMADEVAVIGIGKEGGTMGIRGYIVEKSKID